MTAPIRIGVAEQAQVRQIMHTVAAETLPDATNGAARCALAPAEDPYPCVGLQDAVMLAVWRAADLDKLSGCVLHAGLLLASEPPSKVFVPFVPPARLGSAMAALELARLITHEEADNVALAA